MSVQLVNANSLHIPLADGSVHMVVTSPPYYNAREYSQWKTYEDYLADMAIWWAECYRVLVNGGRIAVNVPDTYGRPGSGGNRPISADTTKALQAVGFEMRGTIVWDKANCNAGASSTAWGSWMSASNPCLRDYHEVIIVLHKETPQREMGESTIGKEDFMYGTKSIWTIPPIRSWHPAPFPVEIPRRLIELYTYKGDIVLDPFSGSGTTVYVAERLGRVGIGLELNMGYARRSMVENALNNGQWELAQSLKKNGTAQPIDDLPLFAQVTE